MPSTAITTQPWSLRGSVRATGRKYRTRAYLASIDRASSDYGPALRPVKCARRRGIPFGEVRHSIEQKCGRVRISDIAYIVIVRRFVNPFASRCGNRYQRAARE